ncbi:D-alanyl-D-alanine carboxypeptidase/D-alanyl-D-alanine-endopeptidase [Streptomyces sp. LP05-1]|uniref:D-alanyl-D-alanine carboxypeptidase/D-alanyl-D-alanine-endopeptidase n=1 Tax=Streptomyces pyxinae TaxID=2970734 RepID=A0ABT2CQH0_9ACTN|nr:D-alanyl-D-alanine carboxypeptidase/D-alanyl-D-alanine-endopeptidase [Streptomyces sp. LP05-1]MCS0639687.1 D-alanyl-D-alanine carboxypeptidase/D-alanyl-D-alanine-endopeptidase [Streptomyces sp. LP05-1]
MKRQRRTSAGPTLPVTARGVSPRRAAPGAVLGLVLGLIALVALGGAAPAGAGPADGGLKGAIDAILADPRLDGGAAGVVIADATTGETLYQHDGGDRLMPASNTKLVTSAAAMALLGPDHRFRTEVLAVGARRGSTLRGDLYLRGGGDPTLLARDYAGLAEQVAAAGITRVTGRLVADDTRFDDRRLGRSWAADDESAYYEAPISALTLAPDTDYDAGTVVVETAPGPREGSRPRVTLTPANHRVRVENLARTLPAGRPATLAVERRHGSDTLVVTGGLPLGAAPGKEWIAVQDPTGYATSVFAGALAARGIRVVGPVRLGVRTPAGATAVAAHDSMPLRELLRPFMKLSNNMHAEALTKAMGVRTADRGDWSAGLAAVGGYLRTEGVDTGALRQVDGSGLSRMNVFPAGQLARLLLAVQDAPWFTDWYAALPVACAQDRMVGGTLRSRMCATPAALNAHAKTGSLTGASALSGYVTDAKGRRLVFSVVLNNFLADSVKGVEDAVVVTLASSDTAGGTIATVRPPRTRSAEPAAGGLECSWHKPAPC